MSKRDNEEPPTQKFDPAAHREKLEKILDKLHAEVYDQQQEMDQLKTKTEGTDIILQIKAGMTNVPKAQKQDKLSRIPADSNSQLGSSYFMVRCSTCHGIDFDSRSRSSRGPPLGLIYGRVSGSDMYYKGYTQNMIQGAVLWNSSNLRKWLLDPTRVIPGNKCGLEPITEDSIAYDICKYLKEFTLLNYNHLKSMDKKLPIAQDYDFSRQIKDSIAEK